VDPDGKWPRWVHNRIIKKAFKGRLSRAQIRILKRASADVDNRDGSQLPKNSYQHGMRAPGETKEHARAKADKFIEDQKELFIKSGDLKKIGEGMHTIMDRTSPSHEGEQVWHGNKRIKNLIKGIIHTFKELNLFRKDDDRIEKASIEIRKYWEDAQRQRKIYLEKQKKDRKKK